MKYRNIFAQLAALLSATFLFSCEDVLFQQAEEEDAPVIPLSDVASLIAGLPLSGEQLREVHDAASSSAGNGYDEEYRMKDLFREPGAGVGDEAGTKADVYSRPLRELIREAVLSTKAGPASPEEWLDELSSSDIQIYWPFSDSWDGEAMPVVTFDPGGDAPANEGYELLGDGSVKKVLVDEEMAKERPVWVINRNSDAEFKTIEMLRREDPSWGSGGGEILVTKGSDDTGLRTLVLRSVTAHRQLDSWFAGGAELWVKMGAVEDFTASTEAELRLYEPSITDFLVVLRRKQVNQEVPFNAVLVSEWTGQLENCALMIIEDDGGTQTSWKCSAMVKVESKSYGFEMELPLRTRDDIVWRGSLTRKYVEQYSGKVSHFGDIDIVLELI